uniref:C-type lectin domain-containing protein n=1 Tax=Astatotilapia calliptera TaxID=8154 RepID=A0AAX7SPA5_ASTCA
MYVTLPDKDHDGHFKWVDKTEITFSNYDSHCDTGYLLYGDFCYYFETKMVKNWQDAEAHCTREQGHLASFHTEEELSFLIGDKGTTKWIGLRSNPIEGGYSWSDGTPLSHTNWGDGEPNNHEGREDCVEMVSNANGTYSLWNDLNCDAHQDWISRAVLQIAKFYRLWFAMF